MWGITHVSANVDRRMRALVDAFPSLHADVVALQEIWDTRDQQFICKWAARRGLPYSHYYRSGVFGSGLLILSRHPIVDVAFLRYRTMGRPEKLWESDYFGGKGVGWARLATPLGYIDVYNTHALAQYVPDDQDDYPGHRAAQMYELARFVNAKSARTPVIAMGDFNVRPDQLGYEIVTHIAHLTDVWTLVHPTAQVQGDEEEQDDEGEKFGGFTIDPQNPYSANEDPKRIDFTFIRGGAEVALRPLETELALTQIPNENLPYSDHYGILTTFEMVQTTPHTPVIPHDADFQRILEELQTLLLEKLEEAKLRRRLHRIGFVTGVAHYLASQFIGRMMEKRFPRFSRSMQVYSVFSIVSSSMVNAWLGLIVVPEEVSSLTAISEELAIQLQSLRWEQEHNLPIVNLDMPKEEV